MWDNALAESFFATIKAELLEHRSWHSHAAARAAIFDYIEGWSQHQTQALHARLPQPRGLREHRRPTGGLTDTTIVSVKAEHVPGLVELG